MTSSGAFIRTLQSMMASRHPAAAMYSQYFGAILRGTSTTINLGSVRAAENNYALADAEQTIYGADGKVVLACHLAALLHRDDDGWRFVDARPYTFPAIPG